MIRSHPSSWCMIDASNFANLAATGTAQREFNIKVQINGYALKSARVQFA